MGFHRKSARFTQHIIQSAPTLLLTTLSLLFTGKLLDEVSVDITIYKLRLLIETPFCSTGEP